MRHLYDFLNYIFLMFDMDILAENRENLVGKVAVLWNGMHASS